MSINNVSQLASGIGGVSNDELKEATDLLQKEKNAQNIKQTIDGIRIDYGNKVMQQIGIARA
ncbi:hypothetical protein EXW72_12970 [Pseudomonas sp. BCA14]|jgi:hypothetical protein|uniref:hypothetical protein n=1 Tax=unclassified Pseudomonas TaxID=196821 RepID=UPI00106DDE77|nr:MULTISPECIES: hypothetical protein [unclassified Pseudomonas]TFF10209.1 hypothetical protein EXW70_14470 [Pseudomonas sp. JMN1]TFF12351.1 hypothetical protein EXW71_12220 [Pseudomonas sp. BCA17]TFF25772.1 hypothetical protein EXW73_15080 [Pseudomonas sp. BCA13]TFF29127.1 hypothetical protein EXW72_12970 [Pseudomonas sp. BCA14]